MNQLELLTIRKQPLQPEPRVPSRTIKAYVRENLRDFPKRQAEREQIRKLYYDQQTKPRKKKEPEAHSFMRTIPITYRAIFEQPRGILNPMNCKLPGAQPVEVFRKGEFWYARELSTPLRQVFERLGKFSGWDSARGGVENAFARRLQPWQIWGTPPSHPTDAKEFRPVERVLSPEEICDLGDGKAGWYEAEDLTHILHQPNGEQHPPAACGARVPRKTFINNRANVEPSCTGCAEVWEREYKDK